MLRHLDSNQVVQDSSSESWRVGLAFGKTTLGYLCVQVIAQRGASLKTYKEILLSKQTKSTLPWTLGGLLYLRCNQLIQFLLFAFTVRCSSTVHKCLRISAPFSASPKTMLVRSRPSHSSSWTRLERLQVRRFNAETRLHQATSKLVF